MLQLSELSKELKELRGQRIKGSEPFYPFPWPLSTILQGAMPTSL